MAGGEFPLHNTRIMLARPAAVFGGLGIVAAGAGLAYNPGWYILGAAGIATGMMFAVIALWRPLAITLSGAGLTARDHRGVGIVPASAIEAVGVSKVGLVSYVTLWYDTTAVPSLPSTFDRYLRSMPPAESGKIYIGAIDVTDTPERISELYRLVQETDLAEWREYPRQSG